MDEIRGVSRGGGPPPTRLALFSEAEREDSTVAQAGPPPHGGTEGADGRREMVFIPNI